MVKILECSKIYFKKSIRRLTPAFLPVTKFLKMPRVKKLNHVMAKKTTFKSVEAEKEKERVFGLIVG